MKAQPRALATPPAPPGQRRRGPARVSRRNGSRGGTETASVEVQRGCRDRLARGSRHSPVDSIASLTSGTVATIRLSGAEMSSSICAWGHAPRPGGKHAATSSGCYFKRRVRKAKAGRVYGFHFCTSVRSGILSSPTVCAARSARAPKERLLIRAFGARPNGASRRGAIH